MAKSKERRRRRSRSTKERRRPKRNVPLAPLMGLAGGFGISAMDAVSNTKGIKDTAQRGAAILDQIGQRIYGYSSVNHKWYLSNTPDFWAPVAGGAVAHIAASKLGINRVLADMKLGVVL